MASWQGQLVTRQSRLLFSYCLYDSKLSCKNHTSSMNNCTGEKQMARPVPYWLFLAVLAAETALLTFCFSLWGTGEDGLLHLARYTARLAFLIFLLTFATSAIATLAPSDVTRWLRRNRRYLGLSFALAHFIHLAALTGFSIAIGEMPDLVTLV